MSFAPATHALPRLVPFSALLLTKNLPPWARYKLRHSTAMHLLQAGVDISVIALWLGHESIETTHIYVEADLAMKERALSAVQAPSVKPLRFRPTEDVLAFLEGL